MSTDHDEFTLMYPSVRSPAPTRRSWLPWHRKPKAPEMSPVEQRRLRMRRESLERMADLAPCCQPQTMEEWRPGGAAHHARTGDCVLRPLKGEPGYVPEP